MSKKSKTTQKSEIPELCAAVFRIRKALGLSQERMARETGIASMTLSRFERGAQVPRDRAVLALLRDLAIRAQLRDEAGLFLRAFENRETASRRDDQGYLYGDPLAGSGTPRVWELMQMMRLSAIYFPHDAAVMEQHAGRAGEIVRETIASAETLAPGLAGSPLYRELERYMNAAAEKSAFEFLNLKALAQQRKSGEPEENR
jgi:transcriptional regulator with XRE-family HTH domain